MRANESSRVRFVSEAERSVIPPIAALTPTLIDLNSSHSSVRGFALSMPFCCWIAFWSGVRVAMRRSLLRGQLRSCGNAGRNERELMSKSLGEDEDRNGEVDGELTGKRKVEDELRSIRCQFAREGEGRRRTPIV